MLEQLTANTPTPVPDATSVPDVTATPLPHPNGPFEVRLKAGREIVEKHGYYYPVLSDEEKIAYELAASCEGFVEEIRLLKTKIMSIQVLHPLNFNLLARFIGLLERLVKTQARLFKQEPEADSGKKSDNIPNRLSSSFGVPMNRAQRRAMARG